MADLRVLVPFSCLHCWNKTLLVVLSNLFKMHVEVSGLLPLQKALPMKTVHSEGGGLSIIYGNIVFEKTKIFEFFKCNRSVFHHMN